MSFCEDKVLGRHSKEIQDEDTVRGQHLNEIPIEDFVPCVLSGDVFLLSWFFLGLKDNRFL